MSTQATLTDLACDIANDSRRLAREELQIFRAEFSREWITMKRAAFNLALGWSLAFTSAVLFGLSLSHWLVYERGIPYWAAFGLTGLIALFFALMWMLVGNHHLMSLSQIPKGALKNMKETMKCLTQSTN